MILDTNAVSALAAKDTAILTKIREADTLSVTLIGMGEFLYGVERSTHCDKLKRWLDAFLAKVVLLSPDLDTLPIYAAIRIELRDAGTPIPANDCWIAALVRQYKQPILSRDVHFDWVSGITRMAW